MIGSCIAPDTFTPVRRRESTVNTGRFQVDQEQEWTTARCHRLLRALTSRVAILTKEISRYSSLHQATDEPKAGPSSKSKITADDGDWTRAKKKIKQTYSSRGRGRGRVNGGRLSGSRTVKGRMYFLPGEVSIPTPILARARGDDAISQSTPVFLPERANAPENRKRKRPWKDYTTSDTRSNFRLSESLREMRKKVTTSRYTTYEGIYNGLETLLQATAKQEPEMKRRGARSLFSTSLRTVPQYITQQEKLLAADIEETGGKSAISSRDISTEIYDELEAFGSSGKSWKELRTVVRSHGLQVVSDAIRAGLLDVEFCGSLVTLCVSTSATEEAEVILSALLCSAPFTEPKTIYDTVNRRLAMLWKYTEYTGHVSFQCRQLSGLISEGVLPISWLATKDFGSFWTALIQLSSSGSINPDALQFLDTALPLLAIGNSARSGCKDSTSTNNILSEAVENTFSSLLTILSSMSILSRDIQVQNQSSALKSPGYDHIIVLLRSCLVDYRAFQQSSDAQFCLLLLANVAVDPKLDMELDTKNEYTGLLLDQLWQQNDDLLDTSSAYSGLAMFISNLSRCCGRGASTSGFDYLQELHLLLETLARNGEGSDALKGVIVDSAYLFSEKVPGQQHVNYAACLDSRFPARVMASHGRPASEYNKAARSGYRWEEGIGEWVKATPLLNNAKHQTMAGLLTMEDDDTECDTPSRPAPQLRRRPGRKASKPSVHALRSLDETSSPSSKQIVDLSDEPPSSDELILGSPSPDESSGSSESISEAEDSLEESFASSRSSTTIEDVDSKGHCPTICRAPKLSRETLRNSQDWQLFDHPSHSATSISSCESSQSKSTRQYVDRAPRLGRRALRSSQAWQIFDESDDELSLISLSSQTSRVMEDSTNTEVSKARHVSQKRPPPRQKKVVAPLTLSDSEDELCI